MNAAAKPTTTHKKSIGQRVLVFLLGSDQVAFVTAAAGVALAWGILVGFFIVHFSTRAAPSPWEGLALGLFLGIFFMPFFFLTISRASRFMSPWEALATMAAASLFPLIMWRLGAREGSGINPFLIGAGCIALVVTAFLVARLIVKRLAKVSGPATGE